MLVYAYNALFIAFCHLGLAIFILFKDVSQKLNYWFALVCISVSLWSFGLYKHTLSQSLIHAQFWDLFLHLSAIIIPWSFIHFGFEFINRKRDLIVNLIDASAIGLFLVFYFKPTFFIVEIIDKPHFTYFPTAQIGYIFYTAWFFLVMTYTMFEFWMFFKKTMSVLKKEQIKYFLTGLIIAFIGASTNFFAVFFKNIQPFGCYLVAIFAFTVGYAIVKHHLLDIDIFIRRGLIYIGVLLLLLIPSYLLIFYLQTVLIGSISPLFSLFMLAILVCFGFGIIKLNQLVEPKLIKLSLNRGYNYESVLKRINDGVSQYSKLNDIFWHLAKLIYDSIGVEKVIFILNEFDSINVYAYDGKIKTGLNKNYLSLFKVEFQHLYSKKEDVVIKDDLHHDKNFNQLYQIMNNAKVEIALPVIFDENLDGIVVLGKKTNKRLFTKQDIDLLKIFSLNIGVVLNNATFKVIEQLNKSLQEKSKNLEKALEELQSTQAQLVHSAKLASVGELAAGVAHELNNALDIAVLGNICLKKWAKKNPEAEKNKDIEEGLQILNDGINRAHQVVKNLLTFSKKDSEGFDLQNIHEGLDSSLNILNNEFRDKVTVHKDYCDVESVYCDLNQLNQVFLNLFKNAVDAISEKGDLWVKTINEGENIRILIKDNGMGIPAAQQDRIFDPFFTTKDVGTGTGLGLSVSYNIIRDHHGTIECRSKEGEGTEFIITIPINFSKELKAHG